MPVAVARTTGAGTVWMNTPPLRLDGMSAPGPDILSFGCLEVMFHSGRGLVCDEDVERRTGRTTLPLAADHGIS